MKNTLSKKLYLAFAFALFASGAAFAEGDRPAKEGQANKEAETGSTVYQSETGSTMESDDASMARKGSESADIPHAEIKFSENQAQLSESDKTNLRNLIRDARAKGEIDQVTVAVWSDKALPQQGQKLLDSDRELASNRAEAISTFLEDEMKVDVETYNMAEDSHWFARTFGTDEAELKSVFGRKGSDEAPVTNEEFRVIRDAGGPSEAVIVVERKMKK